jgi:D-beta-D-heptose 7-phosphate kinase/D-beta-D-heptose 1-phosphate adenosyltransferase
MSTFYRSASDVPEIMPWNVLAEKVGQLQRQGKKVVFTNGVFDLIHPGHVRYLREARQLGDLLIVALNTDDSVKRLKGPERPILPLGERARILAAFEMVDFLTAFKEDTPLELIKVVRPDVLVKGGDYTPDRVVGREFVESYGGICRTVSFTNGYSTTAVVQRIIEMTSLSQR